MDDRDKMIRKRVSGKGMNLIIHPEQGTLDAF